MGWVSGQNSTGRSLAASLRSARRSAEDLFRLAEDAERKLLADATRLKEEWGHQAKRTSTGLQAQLQRLQPPAIRGADGSPGDGEQGRWKARGRARAFGRSRSSLDLRTSLGPQEDLWAALNNTFSANRGGMAGSPYLAPSAALDQVREAVEQGVDVRQLRGRDSSVTPL
jgi:hypothetical protein